AFYRNMGTSPTLGAQASRILGHVALLFFAGRVALRSLGIFPTCDVIRATAAGRQIACLCTAAAEFAGARVGLTRRAADCAFVCACRTALRFLALLLPAPFIGHVIVQRLATVRSTILRRVGRCAGVAVRGMRTGKHAESGGNGR